MSDVAAQGIDAFYEAFGARVRSLREARAITQAILGQAVGLTRSSVANLEAGRQRIPLHIVCDVADVLGVAPGELLPRASNPFNTDVLDAELRRLPTDEDRTFVQAVLRTAVVQG